MVFGFFLGAAACMIWGLVYVIPLILSDFSPLFIAFGRYLVFGAFAAAYLAFNRQKVAALTRSDWNIAIQFGLIGNLLFYWVLSEAVVRIGAAMTGIFTACIPLVASLWVLGTEKRDRPIDPRLWVSLAVITAGLVFLNVERVQFVMAQTMEMAASTSSADILFDYTLGVLYALASVVIWTWYPLMNAKWLKTHRSVSIPVWTAAQGVTLLPISVGALLFGVFGTPDFQWPNLTQTSWLLVLGIGCSWIGCLLWNASSRRLPPVIVGQMLVFETLAAILYAGILDRAWPSVSMMIGSVVVLAGVLASLNILRHHPNTEGEPKVMETKCVANAD